MPTDDTGNGASPTATTVNASEELDVTTLTAEQLEQNPHFQELQKKFSAAHQDMDKTNLSKKELLAQIARLRVLAGEEEKPEIKKEEETQTVTKQQLQEEIWNLKNAKDVDIYGDEQYQKDITAGIPRDYALNTAKLRYQSNPDKARLERQQAMASGSSASVRNLDDSDYEGFDQAEADRWGYTKETWKQQKQMKKARGQ